jgi:hypothetical protein
MRLARLGAVILVLLVAPALAAGQTIPAPDRQPGEGRRSIRAADHPRGDPH